MKRTFTKKPVKAADDSVKMRAKKRLYQKLLDAFNELDICYEVLKDEYKGEMDSIYDDLEIFVRELDADVN